MRRILPRARVPDTGVSRFTMLAGRVALPLMIACGVGGVVGRQFRVGPSSELRELEAIVFFLILMMSFGFAYLRNAHVRIDIVSQHMPARLRAAIELLGCVAVVFPFCAVLAWDGAESAWRSFLIGERLAVGDWQLQWVVRSAVPLGAALLMGAAVAVSARCLYIILAPGERGRPAGDVLSPFDEERAL